MAASSAVLAAAYPGSLGLNAPSAFTNNITLTVWDIANGSGAQSTNLSITILPAASGTPPTISSQPVSVTNLVGGTTNFSVAAGGTGPLFYQWYFNTNTAQLNATNSSLSLTNIQLTNAGYYRVVITNASGSVTSSSALLTVWQPPVFTTNPPAALSLLTGQSVAISVTVTGTPPYFFQWRKAGANLVNGGVYGGVLTNVLTLAGVTNGNAGSYSVAVTNSAGAVTSSVAVVTIALPPTVTVGKGAPGQLQLSANTLTGLTYVVEMATNLAVPVWTSVLTNNTGSSGTANFLTNTTGGLNTFYHLKFP